jgi:hypothetical protein
MYKIRDKKNILPRGERGLVIVIFAVCLFLLIGFAALAIDIGYLHTTRSELQNVADAAALAGARYLGDEYSKLTTSEMATHPFTKEEVYAVINAVAIQNKAANNSISIDIDDVEIGLWDVEQSTDDIWYPTLMGPDAVRVIARRDGTANGPITTFLARIFGIDTMNVTSEKAVAALSGPSFVEEGELKTPFGLSANVFPNDCTDVIAFSPTTDSCAGWHNFFDPINANAMAQKLLGFIQGDTEPYSGGLWSGPQWLQTNFGISPNPEETPTTSTGDYFEFQGGQVASLFNGSYLDSDYDTGSNPGNTGAVLGNPTNKPAPIIALFDYFRYRDDDGDNSVWTAVIPVYKDDSEVGCMNPNTSLAIAGFAEIVIYTTDPPPLSSLRVNINCNFTVIEGRGGGVTYGNLKGTIPNLVR